MNKLWGVAVLSLWPVLLFAQADEPGATETAPEAHQQMQQMQQMQAQMERIRATEDPEERERLLREHMQSMHAGMMMMGEMMRGGMNTGAGPERHGQMQRCAQRDTECRMDEMQEREQMMGQRMNMMQMMMQQMTEQMMQRHAVPADEPSQPETGAGANRSVAPDEPEDREHH